MRQYVYEIRKYQGYFVAQEDMNAMGKEGWDPYHVTDTNAYFTVVYRKEPE